MNLLAPEEIELAKKLRLLDRLKDRLATREEEMTDLRLELEQFEAQYTMKVGRLYADLDDIEAQIAEEEFKLVPDDEEIKKKAEELRRKAKESAARATGAADACQANWHPTPATKKAYHTLAREIHPDLALDAVEKERRHMLMAELNDAYSSGDEKKLNKLVDDFRNNPEMISGDSAADDLVRAIRQIHQVKVRLKDLREERLVAENSELYTLREKILADSAEGRDVLNQMASRTMVHIKKATRRLENLRSVNQAAEEYVKDKYGLDISAFR